MKFSSKSLIILMVSFAWTLQAQYDDVYYDGNHSSVRKKSRVSNYSSSNQSSAYDDYADNEYYNEYSTERESYDVDDYDYYNNDDYAYTNRIRRFNRPLVGRSFYDRYYLDPWNFDPFYYSSGFGFSTPLLSFGFNSFNDYSRWNRWYRFNSFRYWDPWTYSYNPFGFNSYNNYFWATNSWCPTSWYSNNFYYSNNNFYNNNNYWGNRYNNVYQPRYYTDNNIHFGPRSYGSTTSSDRGPSRSGSRVFSDPSTPGSPSATNPGFRRTSPRDVETTTVRERNTPLSRNPQGSIDNNENNTGANGRLSPRSSNENIVRERVPSTERPRTFRDYNPDNGVNNSGNSNQGTNRPSPRFNDNNNTERSRNLEPSTPQRQSPIFNDNNGGSIRSNRTESPRFESPRNESPKFETPRQQSPRFESPRQESPRYQAPRNESPRYEAPRNNGNSNSGSFGGNNHSGSSNSGSSNSGGGSVRSSPRGGSNQ